MSAKELAQKLADYFEPPHFAERRKVLPPKEIMALPLEDRYEQVWIQKNPNSQTYVIKKDDKGHPYITALTFLDVAEAFLKLQEEENNE